MQPLQRWRIYWRILCKCENCNSNQNLANKDNWLEEKLRSTIFKTYATASNTTINSFLLQNFVLSLKGCRLLQENSLSRVDLPSHYIGDSSRVFKIFCYAGNWSVILTWLYHCCYSPTSTEQDNDTMSFSAVDRCSSVCVLCWFKLKSEHNPSDYNLSM